MPGAVVRQLVERSTARYGGDERQKLLPAPPARRWRRSIARPPRRAPTTPRSRARCMRCGGWRPTWRPTARSDHGRRRPMGRHAVAALSRAPRPPRRRPAGRPDHRHAPAEALHAASGGIRVSCRARLIEEIEARGLTPDDPATASAISGLGSATISLALLSRLPLDAVQLAATAVVLGRNSDPAARRGPCAHRSAAPARCDRRARRPPAQAHVLRLGLTDRIGAADRRPRLAWALQRRHCPGPL